MYCEGRQANQETAREIVKRLEVAKNYIPSSDLVRREYGHVLLEEFKSYAKDQAAKDVRKALEGDPHEALPTGRDESDESAVAGASEPLSLYSAAVAELVAIGAAIGANCESCFRYHYGQARKLGVSKADIARAVATARMATEAPSRSILALAERYLGSCLSAEGLAPSAPAAFCAAGGKSSSE